MTAEAATERDAPRAPGRILALDGVRGIAILLVLVCHLWGGLGNESGLELDSVVARTAAAGWIGVDLFFVLSGFLITGILLDARGSSRYFRSFYARRFLRIFPPYYALLFVLILVVPVIPAFRDPSLSALNHYQLWYWTYLQNVAASIYPLRDIGVTWAGHLWSLAVEEQFYLVWPLVVLIAGRRGTLWVCVFCIIGAPILRSVLLERDVPYVGNLFASFILMPARADSLAAGGLVAILLRDSGARGLIARLAPLVAVLCVAVVGAISIHNGRLDPFAEDVRIVVLSALAIGFAAFIAMVDRAPAASLTRRICEHHSLTFLGRYSYGLYLFHFPIAFQLGEYARAHDLIPTAGGSELPGHVLFALVTGALTVAIALLSWHLVEQPILRLKRRFPYDEQRERVLPAPEPVSA